MNFNWNIETYISIAFTVTSLIVAIIIIKINWKQYGLLFLLSGVVGSIICYIFIITGLYSFPYRLFPNFLRFPFYCILTIFPAYVLLGVRYSPKLWALKIPVYWVIVHLGMVAETWAHNKTQLIRYDLYWDFWDSYTWWWIFFLIFEWVGGLIVSEQYRKPINPEVFKYGKIGFFIIHFILITTIFLGGFYAGRVTMR
ncbi:hypothetical protein OXPF_01090 [Oxobacter pfennigii]|uniref:Uncharacterized protein n=1 Tax=Oxobacter pfennigii TaxID=36849 RepID=A0A0N8NU02_9CLOT|nr:CBO0543 family protein [Oxobacter pfennigii]KPU46264.1 hypothetical protein OXPF_01090 [Oxobacter pfennigii]